MKNNDGSPRASLGAITAWMRFMGALVALAPTAWAFVLWVREGLSMHVFLWTVPASGIGGVFAGVWFGRRSALRHQCMRLSRQAMQKRYEAFLRAWERHVHPAQTNAVGNAPVHEVMQPLKDCIVVSRETDGRQVLDDILRRMDLRSGLPIALVVDEQKLVGVVTPSDLPAKFDLFHPQGRMQIRTLMTVDPAVARVTQSWESAEEFRLRGMPRPILSGLPVLDEDGKPVGFLPPMGGRDPVDKRIERAR